MRWGDSSVNGKVYALTNITLDAIQVIRTLEENGKCTVGIADILLNRLLELSKTGGMNNE